MPSSGNIKFKWVDDNIALIVPALIGRDFVAPNYYFSNKCKIR